MLRTTVHRLATAFLIPVVCALGTVGCSRQPAAIVNGRPVEARTLELHVKERLLQQGTPMRRAGDPRLRRAVVEELIVEQLILDEALKHGITATDEEAKKAADQTRSAMGEEAFGTYLSQRGMKKEEFLRDTRDRIIMERFRSALESMHPVTENDIRESYRNSPRPFVRTPQSLVKMVEMPSESDAREAIREMRRKKLDFDEMASRLAAEGKASVMDYGWALPRYFAPPVAQAIMNLGIGQYGGPYKGKKGYFLIRVKDREQVTIASFDEVKEEIRQTLREQRRQNVFAMWLDQKRRSSAIEVYLN